MNPIANPEVSLLMRPRPGEFECVLQQVLKVEGTEIESTSDAGELRVRLAAGNRDELYRRIDFLQFVEGLQSSTLSYH